MKLEIQNWSIDELQPYVRNARTHTDEQIAQVAASIVEFGFVNPILVGADKVIIAGHARLAAARRLKMTEVPVIVLDHLSDTQRRALILADNRLAMSAGWDETMLAEELAALDAAEFNLDLLGFTDEEVEELLADPDDAKGGLTDPDEAPEVQEVAVARRGDVWLLGDHRLVCGDATNADDVARLMGSEKADLVFTDPPYNVSYEGYTADKLTIQNDAMSGPDYQKFLRDTFVSYRQVTKTGASLYVCHGSIYQREFQAAIEAAGFEVRCQIIWAKNTFAWGFGRYKFQHEPIFYCHVKGESDAWYGDKSQSTLWQEKKPSANRLHPTMKPVELTERALVNSSKKDDIVLDLFGGSGSTLIAAERMGRKARLMELDPRYVDVIICRWQDYTGETAELEGSGTFDEVERERLEHAA